MPAFSVAGQFQTMKISSNFFYHEKIRLAVRQFICALDQKKPEDAKENEDENVNLFFQQLKLHLESNRNKPDAKLYECAKFCNLLLANRHHLKPILNDDALNIIKDNDEAVYKILIALRGHLELKPHLEKRHTHLDQVSLTGGSTRPHK